MRGDLFVVLLSLAAVFPAAAQTEAQFSDSQDVVAVEVPVQVLRDGEPVRGLSAADFEVWEGRRKLPVTGFEALDLNRMPAGDERWKTPQAISARRHFLLLFDMGFSSPKGVEKAQGAARDMLAGLHPSDLVAVAAYVPSAGPQLLLGFTSDRAQVAQALEALGKPEMFNRSADPLRLVLGSGAGGGYGGDPPRDLAEIRDDIRNATSPEERRELIKELKAASMSAAFNSGPAFTEGTQAKIERMEREGRQRAVTAMARAFEDLAKTVGSLYGRKYVVLFSEGFDASVFTGTANVDEQLRDAFITTKGASAWGVDSARRFGDTKTLNDLEAMLEELRRADCVIQAVDVGGLREGAGPTAQWAGGRDSLFLLAESTGGELFENYNDLSDAMEQMLRRTSVTYVLSVQPEGLARDGSWHQLEVRLKNAPRGTRAVHRPGYYAPRPAGQQSPTEKLLQTARGLVVEGEAGTIATSVLAAPFPTGGPEAYVPVIVEVDGRSLKAGTEGWTVPVEIYAYAFDAHGQARDFFSQTLGLELLKVGAALEQTGLKFFGHLDLPPGTWAVRVLVRNASTGAAGARSVTVNVPEFGKAEPVLLPAFFPEPAGRWLTVRESQPGDAAYPFMAGGQPYIPASLPRLIPGEEAPLSLVAYHLRPGELRAEARVQTLAGRDAGAGRIRIVERRGDPAAGAESLSARFEPPAGLAPGEYLLTVTLTGPAGEQESSVTSFAVAAAEGS